MLLAGAVMLSLCACSTDAIPELSEDEMQQVEEYAAHLLLKYDANYEMTTVTMDEIASQRAELERRAQVQAQIAVNKAMQIPDEPETSEPAQGQGGDTPSGQSTAVYTDIDDFYEESNLEIDYIGYEVSDTYPNTTQSNDWQGVVRATNGNTLVVFRFQISNTGSEDMILNMLDKGAKFNFRINGSVSKTALRTMRLDELAFYKDTIPAGGSREAVVIIELDPQTAAQLSTIKMTMRYGEKRAELTLLN